MDYGMALALLGVGMAIFLPGIGSALGIYAASKNATAILSEKPERYGQFFIMVVLPGTQGFYGFLDGLIGMLNLGLFAGPGNLVKPTVPMGLTILLACLPVAIAGLVTAIYQGRVAAAGILMAGKRPEMAFKAGVVYAVMVEIYAILGLLATLFMLLYGVNWPKPA
jgi:V/A-type H+-transporting ATPase subunit K